MHRSLTIHDLLNAMPDMHVVHFHCLVWRMQCLSHRLLEFGWESSVKRLEPHEAVVLAACLPPVMHDAILATVLDHGDERWSALVRTLPQFAEVACV